MARQKGINKEKVGFSLDKEVASELQEFCNDNSVNKSHLVNRLIKKYLDKYKKIIEI
jgi:metal-responsive CopG/Arc/MetJ family transcriptional regulator